MDKQNQNKKTKKQKDQKKDRHKFFAFAMDLKMPVLYRPDSSAFVPPTESWSLLTTARRNASGIGILL